MSPEFIMATGNISMVGLPSPASGPISSNSDPVILGNWFPSSAYSEFNGTIDDVLIYNRALNETELEILFDHYRTR